MLQAQQEAYDREAEKLQTELNHHKAEEIKIKASLAATQEQIEVKVDHLSEMEQQRTEFENYYYLNKHL